MLGWDEVDESVDYEESVDYGVYVPDEVLALVQEQRRVRRRRIGATHARHAGSRHWRRAVLVVVMLGAVTLAGGLGLALAWGG